MFSWIWRITVVIIIVILGGIEKRRILWSQGIIVILLLLLLLLLVQHRCYILIDFSLEARTFIIVCDCFTRVRFISTIVIIKKFKILLFLLLLQNQVIFLISSHFVECMGWRKIKLNLFHYCSFVLVWWHSISFNYLIAPLAYISLILLLNILSVSCFFKQIIRVLLMLCQRCSTNDLHGRRIQI